MLSNLKSFFKNKLQLVMNVMIVFGLINCYSAGTGINMYTDYGFTDTNPTPKYSKIYYTIFKGGKVYHRDSFPVKIGSGDHKVYGEGCNFSLFYLVSWGDSSFASIKKEFNIKKLGHIEYEQLSVFGSVFHRFCTKVYGE